MCVFYVPVSSLNLLIGYFSFLIYQMLTKFDNDSTINMPYFQERSQFTDNNSKFQYEAEL